MTDVSRIRPMLLLVSLLVVGGVGVVYWIEPPELIETRSWLPVVPEPLEQRLAVTGRIVPRALLTVSAPFESILQDKWFADDQLVARGQLLVKLDTDLLQMQIRESLAERLKAESAVRILAGWGDGEEVVRARRSLNSSQLSLADTRRKLAESEMLLRQGIVPRMEVDNLTQQVKAQSVEVKAALSELMLVSKRGEGDYQQVAELQLANARARHSSLLALQQQSEIRAPFAGIIVRLPAGQAGNAEKPVEPGVRLSQGQPLFGLANLERLSVQARVDEVDVNQLRVGMSVEISGDGFNDRLQGIVSTVSTQAIADDIQSDSATYHVTVAVPALDPVRQQRLRLGMSARLSILTYQNPNAIVLPAEAIGEEGGKHFVSYRSAVNGSETKREVTLGRAALNGVEVFGINGGFVRKEVDME